MAVLLAGTLLLIEWNSLRSVDPAEVSEADPTASTPGTPSRGPLAVSESGALQEQELPLQGDLERVSTDWRMQTLEGTVSVGFKHGPPVLNAEGTFRIYTYVDQQDFNDTVEVHEGRFTTMLPGGGELSVWDLELEGKRAELEPGSLAPDASGRVELRAVWDPITLLHVREALTGTELTGVELFSREAPGNGCRMLPTPSQRPKRVTEDGFSPIEVPGRKVTKEYWARAPGYAWKAFELSSNAEESEVRLETAGTLLIELTEYDPAWNVLVRIKRGQALVGFNRAELEIETRALTRAESLEPGAYTVTVEQGEWYNPISLGSSEATVSPGHQGRVVVRTRPPAESAQLVPVEGTLQVWPGDFYRDIGLSLLPLSEDLKSRQAWVSKFRYQMTKVEDQPSELRWNLGRVLPGDYRLTVFPNILEQELSVGPAGFEDLHVVTPALHPVTIRLKRSGEMDIQRLPLLHVHWKSGSAQGRQISVRSTEGLDEYTTQLPEGSITAGFGWHPLLWVEDVEGSIRPGPNLFECVLRQSCCLKVTLFEAGRPLPVDQTWLKRVIARSVQNSEEQTPRDYDSELSRLRFRQAGPHHLVFPDLEGYAPIEPIEVLLVPGQTREVSVPVVAQPADDRD